MLQVVRQVEGGTRYAVCKSRNASVDKAVNVVRDSSDSDRSATRLKLSSKIFRAEGPLLRVCIRPERLQSKIGKLSVELAKQPRT